MKIASEARGAFFSTLLLLGIVLPVSARDITFEDVMGDLSKTTLLATPDSTAKEEGSYLQPSLDIYPLWEKLGVKEALLGRPTPLFACDPEEAECFLPASKIKVTGNRLLKVLQLTERNSSDILCFLFAFDEDAFYYFDHLAFSIRVPDELLLEFLEDDLFAVTLPEGHGQGYQAHGTRIYLYSEKQVREALRYDSFCRRKGVDKFFDVSITSARDLTNDGILIQYDIQVIMSAESYQSAIPDDLPQYPVIHVQRTLYYQRNPAGFTFDEGNSTTSPEQIASLCRGGRDDYYAAFIQEFDRLGEKDPKTREWFSKFKKGLTESR